MANSFREAQYFRELESEHRKWLSGFDQRYLSNWNGILNSNQEGEEAALAEAGIRRLFQGCGVTVAPNEDLTNKVRRPDFLCYRGRFKFYVEVKNISREAATRATGIPSKGCSKVSPFKPMLRKIFWKSVNSTGQFDRNDAASLLAITTFHSFAAMATWGNETAASWLFLGETKQMYAIDMRIGKQVGEPVNVTQSESTLFLNSNSKDWLDHPSISGLFLKNLMREDISDALCILHPEPVFPFDSSILPQVKFGQGIVDRTTEEARVEWLKKRVHATQDTERI